MKVKRFYGTLAAMAILAMVLFASKWFEEPAPVSVDPTPDIFRFEKEDMVAFKVERSGQQIEVIQTDGTWQVSGETWRPSRSMIRRVAHQLHDLTARAIVAEGEFDPKLYGLGDNAAKVEVRLRDGRSLRFLAGDPNPTSVSYYVQPTDEDAVYVVKKSSMDYYYFDVEEFRERRFATINADDADAIVATVDGRTLNLHRIAEKQWRMTIPVEQDVEREEARTMLGRTGALKAMDFIADAPGPERMTELGLDPPQHKIQIGSSDGETVTLWIGHQVPETDPQLRYVWRDEDQAVYTAREGFLEAFQKDLQQYRRRTLLTKHEWDVTALTATKGDDAIAITKSSDDWRWPDESPIPGSTPKRVAGRACEVKALEFHDSGLAAAGIEQPFATVELHYEDGGTNTVIVGAEFEAQTGVADRPTHKRRYIALDDSPIVYEVEASVGDVIKDLFREYGRKLDKDRENLATDSAPK